MSPLPQHYSCPPPARGLLNFETIQAVRLGKIDTIRTFLKEGGDVNGSDASGCTLIFAACQQGRVEIVEELLKEENIHLNVCHMGTSPLTIAAINEHEACVKTLLASDLQCRINVDIQFTIKNNTSINVLGAVAMSRNWKVFSILLEEINEIVDYELINIIYHNIMQSDQWNIMKDILQKDLCWQGTNHFKVLKEAYLRQLWDIVDIIFRKAIIHENYSVLKILKEMQNRKNWERLESHLKVLCESAKVELSLAEALRGRQYHEVEKMLKQSNYDNGALTGGLFVATITGTSEKAAELFLSRIKDYSTETLRFVLILATVYDRMEFVPLLLKQCNFTYKTLSMARSMADCCKSMESVKLLKLSLSNKACKLFPEVKNLMCNDIENTLMNDIDNDDE